MSTQQLTLSGAIDPLVGVHPCPIDGCAFVSGSKQGAHTHFGHAHTDAEIRGVLLAEIERLADELGRTSTYDEMKEHGRFGACTYQKRFGSWNAALEAAGLGLNSRHGIPDEELLAEIERLADELGRAPTRDEMDAHGRFGGATYKSHFGSWNAALEAAGIEPNRRHDIPDEELLAEIERLADELGRAPTYDEMNDHGRFDGDTCRKRFGSWNAALEATGIEPSKRVDIPEAELLAEIKRVADELGYPPSTSEMADHGWFSAATYQCRFGSWASALRAAGFDTGGWVYVATQPAVNPPLERVKIGLSSDPERRMAELTRGSGLDTTLEIAVQVPDPGKTERTLHDEFAAHRTRGEYFDLPPDELEALVARLQQTADFLEAETIGGEADD